MEKNYFYRIEKEDGLFVVYSYVTNKGMFGAPNVFKNYVSTHGSVESAEAMISKLEAM